MTNPDLIQTSETARKKLVKQQYRFVGQYFHTAVKICGWTKNLIRGEGGCYKLKFYGIMSHQCLQMSPSISCANRCIFCWRDYKSPVSKDWKWGVDDPVEIVDGSIAAHHKLLLGFKGNPKSIMKAYDQSRNVRHVALSLTGEPITYPRMNELVDEFHRRKISTFLVTNATYPEQIRDLHPITQLYLSLDAPNKELLKEVDKPLFDDYWERLNLSLDNLAQKQSRTCIRLTMIKGVNMVEPENYARLILKGSPDFVEVKAYMFVGASCGRLERDNMPLHEEVVVFSEELVKHLPGYEVMSEHISSRVVLLAKTKFKDKDGRWGTWIDFDRFFALVEAGQPVRTEDFLRPTPNTGLSGQGTMDYRKPKDKDVVYIDMIDEVEVHVDEETPELAFWTDDDPSDDQAEDPSADGC